MIHVITTPISIVSKFSKDISAYDFNEFAEMFQEYCNELYQFGVQFTSSFTNDGLSINVPNQIVAVHKNNYVNLVKTLYSA